MSEADTHVRALDLQDHPDALTGADAARSQAAGTAAAPSARADRAPLPHPGLGEFGLAEEAYRAHARRAAAKIGPLTFALVGNQNCGKTTLFNQLTGANQHVGNFPGVTVDRKDGAIRGHAEATVTDLPGVYSLSPYSNEEIVTRDFLLDEKPDGIINIVDGTNIERNLYLTMQIMELGIPMVLALNMMDEVEANGGTVRVNELEAELGIPVVPISAAKNEGVRRAGRPRPARGALRRGARPHRLLLPQARKSTTRSARCTAASTPRRTSSSRTPSRRPSPRASPPRRWSRATS